MDETKITKYFCHKSACLLLLIASVLLSTSCGPGATDVSAIPSATVVATIVTPHTQPTETLVLTHTPSPTNTLEPTHTIIPTEIPSPFVPKATIKIASHGPLSGQIADIGTTILHGAELAVSQLDGSLMELGYKVEFVPFDDQMDNKAALEIANQIVDDPDILCLVGPYTSQILNQVKEIYHRAGLAFISPSATAAYASASGYPEVNRVVGRHDGQGIAGAQFANAQGFSRVFIIRQSGDYAQFNAFHFGNEADRLGIDVVGNISTNEIENFGQLIDRVIETDADMVYFSTLSVDQAGAFFREARAAGYVGAFLGNEGIANPALVDFAGPLAIEDRGLYYTGITAPAIYYPEATQFLEDFEMTFGDKPQMFAAQGYDAAGICLKAIEEATQDGEIPTRNEVANAIRALEDYPGITGTFNFNEHGDPDPAQYFVFQVVSPDPNDWDQNPLVAMFEVAAHK